MSNSTTRQERNRTSKEQTQARNQARRNKHAVQFYYTDLTKQSPEQLRERSSAPRAAQ